MDLWIKSQDNNKIRKIMLKVHTIELGDCNKNYCIVANDLYNVGIYKTEKRALEVLDEIQNILKPKIMIRMDENVGKVANFLNIDGEYVQNTGNADIKNINNSYVYEMPEE